VLLNLTLYFFAYVYMQCAINGQLQSQHNFQQKFGSKCSLPLCDFVNAMFPTLTKQTILPFIQKAMPIILTLFSTKINVVPFLILKLFWEYFAKA